MPVGNVIDVDSSTRLTEHAGQVLRADDLFIRCDDAVFSGTQIQARLLDAVVTNNVTIEDLLNEFHEEARDASFSTSLHGLFSLTQGFGISSSSHSNSSSLRTERSVVWQSQPYNSGIAAHSVLAMTAKSIPQIRVANRDELVREVQHLASMVGLEKFYLKVGKVLHKKSAQVGLVKDGVVNASSSSREAERRGDPMPTSETIEAERIIDEQLHETHEHNNTVFNPCVAEFIGMMSEVAEMQEVHREIERQKAIRQINPEVLPNLSARDRIISLLLKDGASSQEIEEVFTAITPIAERAKRQQKQYAIHTFIVPNDADEAMAKRCEIEQTEIHNRNCLASTLQLFVDSAVMVNDFAEKNPKLAEFALTALDVTLSRPSKFAMNYCSKELGIQEKVNEYKDVAKSWLSGKLASISGMSQEYSELLVSGGLFGAEIGLIALGISNKNKVIDEAKNVAKKVEITINVKKNELKKFGVMRKIEGMKYNSQIGQNKLTFPQRNTSITRDARKKGEKLLKQQGKNPDILKKVDVDHTHELQLGGADAASNLQFLDKSFNRSIGRRVNQATKDMPEGTKVNVKFKVKETGEDL